MKLAILAVYMVAPENGQLLDLHLDMIDRYTEDYTIYASINRLLPEYHAKLFGHPRVNVVSIPDTELRGAPEHSYYLEQLITAAMLDGASHLVTLHVDSFPVEAGWAELLAGQLSADCVLATTSKWGVPFKPTACLFFSREFYIQYQPELLLSPTVLESRDYQKFEERYPVVSRDSGISYCYLAWQNKLQWVALARANGSGIGQIYGGLIFHLEYASYMPEPAGGGTGMIKKRLRNSLNAFKTAIMPFVFKTDIYQRNGWGVQKLAALNRKLISNSLYAEERKALMEDPDRFIAKLKRERL